MVFELLSLSVFDFLKQNDFKAFPQRHIQSFARQLFTSVAFIHGLTLVHTDLKPENVLLVSGECWVNEGQRRKSQARQQKDDDEAGKAAKRQKHNEDAVVAGQSGDATSNVNKPPPSGSRELFDAAIRLIDFGSTVFDSEFHPSVVSTRHYRAPEVVLGLGWSYPCDIWSIGCILVEFLAGEALFQTHENLEHLAIMERVLGPLPVDIVRETFKQMLPSSVKYFQQAAATTTTTAAMAAVRSSVNGDSASAAAALLSLSTTATRIDASKQPVADTTSATHLRLTDLPRHSVKFLSRLSTIEEIVLTKDHPLRKGHHGAAANPANATPSLDTPFLTEFLDLLRRCLIYGRIVVSEFSE